MDALKQRGKIFKRRAAKKARNRFIVHTAKDKPCVDCGIKYPYYVMQFDHRPDTIKKESIKVKTGGRKETKVKDYSALGGAYDRNGGTARILAEIEKCDVVCANCHLIRTYRRMQIDG